MKYSELKATVRAARLITRATEANFTEKPLDNGWRVRVVWVLAFRCNKLLYYLIDPKGFQHGGYDRQDSFLTWAMKFMGDH